MTTEEQRTEWLVERDTRIGTMCGAGEPTDEQKAIASKIADEHVAACMA